MDLYNPSAAKRPVNLILNADLVIEARAAGLNLSALAEQAVAAALASRAQETLEAAVVQACAVHEVYPAEYGSPGEAVRQNRDAIDAT